MIEQTYIFLDVDYVLNSIDFDERHIEKYGRLPDIFDLCPMCLQRLSFLVKTTRAKIILSSSWRDDKIALKELTNELARHGMYISGMTAPRTSNLSRTDEIKNYLIVHPEVKNYVILDDLEITDEELIKHHVKTVPTHGLTSGNVLAARKVFAEYEY